MCNVITFPSLRTCLLNTLAEENAHEALRLHLEVQSLSEEKHGCDGAVS